MYQALYRKYRPKTFEDVVGQNYVIETLKNEIINDKVNHAYMFFGPRGIGKTTIAKIFARAVNCEKTTTGSPCEECERCISSKEKECVDIIEIDAASNNGVDEIREIRNKVSLVPAELKYKVYIIDEVHMLTQGAFNALLKTLEEPPKHVIFILATTDPQKVSDTIISRCQCFSFKRISEVENYNRLKEICGKENIKVSDDVLKEVSLYSDGGLRDSLGMLDKLSSYKSTDITIEDFYEMNDMIDIKSINELYTDIINGNIQGVIGKLEYYNTCGKNIIEITNQLLHYLKNKIIDYYVENKQLDNVELTEKLLQFINEKMFDIKKTSKPYIYVEIIMLQFINQNKIISREIISGKKTEESTEKVEKIKSAKVEEKPEIEVSTEIVDKNENEEFQQIEEEKISTEYVEENLNQHQEEKKQSLPKINIKDIMKIRVNNTLAEASKKEKEQVTETIQILNDYVFDPDKGYIASELLNATICAVSETNMIISYEYDSVVEQNLENINKITEIFNEITGLNKKIAIISNQEWNEEKNKYIEFTKQGNKYTIIEEPVIQPEEEIKKEEQTSESTSSAVELFGDIVEIK